MRPRPLTRRTSALAAASLVACTVLTPAAIADRLAAPPVVAAPAAAVSFAYLCSSTHGQTAETYLISGTVDPTVVQGTSFTLTVVVTGTPSVDLLLDHLTVALDAPLGVTSVDGLSRTIPGPGSLTPPGPVAPAGQPNSTPPLTFTFLASGAVGTTVDFFSGPLSTVVVQISDPSVTLPVTCTRTGSGSFASTVIVAPATTTTSTSTTSTTTTAVIPTSTTSEAPGTTSTTVAPDPNVAGARVLGDTTDRVLPVVAVPSFTG